MKTRKEQLKNMRNEWVRERWDENKAEMAMSDFAEIYNRGVATIHRILKGRN